MAQRAKNATRAKGAKNGSVIVSGSKNPLHRLPIKKLTYVKARAAGANVGESASAAGVSACMGSKYEKDSDIQAAYRLLVRKAIPAKQLVRLIKGGTRATMPEYTTGSEGNVTKEKVADWKTRRPYIEMAAEHGGYFEKKVDNHQTLLAVNIQHIGQPKASKKIVVVDAQRSQPLLTTSTETD